MRDDIETTVRALSLEQKASLCLGSDFWHTTAVPGVESVLVSDGPHGLRRQPDGGDHVGIGGSVPATCFPTASALGSSWDPALANEIGRALGLEAREQDVSVVLGPGINIKRSPLCGRNFEYLSEDPLLSGVLGSELVKGLQSQHVGASVKHFAANNQETDRLRVSSDVDERTLREIYLPAFERVVTEAKPWTVMCSYNKVNGEYASQNHWLLTDLLRGEWGFDGVVVSDWGAVVDRVAALAAGLDLEMPPNLGISDRAIVEAVRAGSLDESLLDQAVSRMLRLIAQTRQRQPASSDAAAQHALARRAAGESLVLLKNDDGVLPLQDAPGLSVAVIGEFARTPRYQGAGSSQVNPTRVDVPLEELGAALPSATLRFAPGFTLDDDSAGSSGGSELLAEAIDAASAADVVVAFLGLPAAEESEGFDRTHIDLPKAQTDLIHALAEAVPATPIVVVLANGSVVEMSSWDGQVAAVVECWLAGQAMGSAVCDVLTGAVNPSGRLTETVPVRLQDTPSYLNFPGEEGHVRYGEGVFVGYRGFDAAATEVAYPFGHGLSYTDISYQNLDVQSDGAVDDDDLRITVTWELTNAGSRAGAEVAQVYLAPPPSPVARAPRELKAFRKVRLSAGSTEHVSVTLGVPDLAYWSTALGGWVVEPGEYAIEVGASSRDIRLAATVSVRAPRRRPPLTASSTLIEWKDDPVAGPELVRAVGVTDDGRPAGILGDEELIKVIGNFPLRTLIAFTGLGITEDVVSQMMARFAPSETD